MKNSFVFYTEWIEQIRLLEKHGTQKDLDAFWDALRSFVEDGNADPETALAEITFVPMRNQISRDAAKYEEISEKRRQARTKDNKHEQTITNHNKQEQTTTNATEDEDVDEDDDVSTNVDILHTAKESELKDEFESIWLAYPRKVGKKDAYRHYKAARREGTTFDEVYNGVLKYRKSVSGTEEQYIAQGSTWFCGHRWEDDITGTPRAKPKHQLTAEEILAIPAINPWSEEVST